MNECTDSKIEFKDVKKRFFKRFETEEQKDVIDEVYVEQIYKYLQNNGREKVNLNSIFEKICYRLTELEQYNSKKDERISKLFEDLSNINKADIKLEKKYIDLFIKGINEGWIWKNKKISLCKRHYSMLKMD